MKPSHPISGERCRVHHRLKGAAGLADALLGMARGREQVSGLSVLAVVSALAFHIEQLCDEFDFDPYAEDGE